MQIYYIATYSKSVQNINKQLPLPVTTLSAKQPYSMLANLSETWWS